MDTIRTKIVVVNDTGRKDPEKVVLVYREQPLCVNGQLYSIDIEVVQSSESLGAAINLPDELKLKYDDPDCEMVVVFSQNSKWSDILRSIPNCPKVIYTCEEYSKRSLSCVLNSIFVFMPLV